MLPISPDVISRSIAKNNPLLRQPALVVKPRRPQRFLTPLLVMWNTYNALLTRYPLPTEMITAGLLWMSGDVMAQHLEHRLDPAPTAAKNAIADGIAHDVVEDDDDDDATTAFSTSSSSDISSSQTDISVGNTAMEIDMPAEATPVRPSGTRTPLDWKRTRIQTLYAAMLWGPAGHYWYEWLDGTAQSMAPLGTARFVGIKLLLEIILLHPVALTAFFLLVGLMGNEKFRDIIEQLRSDFLPSLMLEYMLWIPCDIAMFAFVPARHQLLVVNTICLIESVMLSYIKSNGISLPGHGGGDSGEGKKKDEYRQVDVAGDDETPKQLQDVFVDQDISSKPKPRLLPSIQQRMRGWRRRKSSHLQEMSPREARPLHVA